MGGSERVATGALLALWAWACSVDPIDIEGKDCPCAPKYTCDPRTNTCIIGNASGGSAGVASGGAAGSGAGGIAGSAGAASGGGGTSNDASLGGTSSGDASTGGTGTGGGSGGTTASGGTGGASSGKGSCVGHCDLVDSPVPGSKPACYCDAACEGYGDCCSDKIAVCGKAPSDAGTPDGGG